VYARTGTDVIIRNYAVAAGDQLEDTWETRAFADGIYHLQVYGPNGFFREFMGTSGNSVVELNIRYEQRSGDAELFAVNHDAGREFTIDVNDQAYKTGAKKFSVPAGGSSVLTIDTEHSAGWYDCVARIGQIPGAQWRFAGRVETGKWSTSDPLMGGVLR
jgi:phospholipase C